MPLDAETRAYIDQKVSELNASILANAEARNASDLDTAATIRSLQAAVGEGVVADWAREGNLAQIPAPKLATSDAGLYILMVSYTRLATSWRLDAPDEDLIGFFDTSGRYEIREDGPIAIFMEDNGGIDWFRGGTEIFDLDQTGSSLGPIPVLKGDQFNLSQSTNSQIRICRYGAVPTPIASVDNLLALLRGGGGIEISKESGQVLFEASEHSDNYVRRIGWSADSTITSAELLAGVMGTTSTLQLPAVSSDQYLGVWLAGSRILTGLDLDGVDSINLFTRSSLTVAGVQGTLYSSNSPLRMDLGETQAVLRSG